MAPWYEEAEFYHIYPIGLTGAPRKNESEETVHRFSTLEQWLPHIADLGCTAIYIGPLFESTTHGYDTKDYKQVDRRLGDNADFAAYVKKAHELGIKVVVDGVFNHTGREFFAFRDIQEKREQSPYCGWYKGIWFGGNTCYNDGFSYEAWRNCFELVNLNLQNQQVRDFGPAGRDRRQHPARKRPDPAGKCRRPADSDLSYPFAGNLRRFPSGRKSGHGNRPR